jgi:hypothetical protein
MQMYVDLLMEVKSNAIDLKFKAFRGLAYCNLHSGNIYMYIRNLMMALSISEKIADNEIPIAETYMDLALA